MTQGQTAKAGSPNSAQDVLTPKNFEVIKAFLYDTAGIHLAEGKMNMVQNRIAKRKGQLGLVSFDEYIEYFQRKENGDELTHLVNALTTNVTRFFREEHHFDFMKKELKQMLQSGQRRIRIWSAACSIGAEPYSMAIAALEAKRETGQEADIKILATDIDTVALKHARKGEYEEKSIKGLSRPRLSTFFTKREVNHQQKNYQVTKDVRNLVSFNYLNFNDNPWPMTGPFDFIFCRNALIYFDSVKQNEYVGRMTGILGTGKYLCLGHSEYFLSDSREYEALGNTIFRKK